MSDSESTKRILVIDREPALAESLKRMLRPIGAEWDVEVESSPKRALERMNQARFDVVLTDERAPAVDGASLLSAVFDRHPEVVRLVMTASANGGALRQTVPLAHQCVPRSTAPSQLPGLIARVSLLRDRLHDENMRALIGEIESLPAMPAVCRELNELLARADYAMTDVAAVVEKEPAVCAKILQIVNSAYFGVGRKISDVTNAVSFLGTSMTRNLVTSASMWRAVEGARPAATRQLESIYQDCQRVGSLARRMLGRRPGTEEAFVGGLLHDIGMTLMIAYLPERFERVSREAVRQQVRFHEVEATLYNINHADIGAYLLDAWGLAFPVLEAVAFHHTAPELENSSLLPADAVYIASRLLEASREGQDPELAIDRAYLGRLGVSEQLSEWAGWMCEV